jgi:hypothetical protein
MAEGARRRWQPEPQYRDRLIGAISAFQPPRSAAAAIGDHLQGPCRSRRSAGHEEAPDQRGGAEGDPAARTHRAPEYRDLIGAIVASAAAPPPPQRHLQRDCRPLHVPVRNKRRMSAAGRERFAEAARRRWAAINAANKAEGNQAAVEPVAPSDNVMYFILRVATASDSGNRVGNVTQWEGGGVR